MVGLEDESTDGLGEALVDSDKAGQVSASITEPSSTMPFVGLFQATFLGLAEKLWLLLALELSTTRELLEGGEEGAAEAAAFGVEQFSDVVCSSTGMAREDDGSGGD